MAELLGVVAGGAGLASLAVQLVDSAEKLRRFTKASKNASQSVDELVFEIETLSFSLRYLERHQARDNNADSALLERCVVTCRAKVAQISDLVARMELKLRNFDRLGKLYVAFKEPEVTKLLDEMERAKSSIQFAYVMFCQSWSMRESDSRAAIEATHRDQLAKHSRQLDQICNSSDYVTQQVRLLVSAIASTPPSTDNESLLDDQQGSQQPQNITKSGNIVSGASRRTHRARWQLRLALPFRTRAWHVAVEIGASLTVHMQPINIRPWGYVPFQYLEDGDVAAVRRCLATGELTVWDQNPQGNGILFYAAFSRNTELVAMLLREAAHLHDDATLEKAFVRALSYAGEPEDFMISSLLALFIDYGMDVDFNDHASGKQIWDLTSPFPISQRVSDACADVMLRNQPLPMEAFSFEQRFDVAMLCRWSPKRFLSFIMHNDSHNRAATHRDGQGRTALHWLASRWSEVVFGLTEWVGIEARGGAEPQNEQNEIEEIMLELLSMGADPSTLDDWGNSPLRTMLLTSVSRYARKPVRFIADALGRWSRAIQASGRLLATYVSTERMHYTPVELQHDSDHGISVDALYHDPIRACIAFEGHRIKVLRVKELHSVPGQFPWHEYLPRHIVWEPSNDEAEEARCWSTTMGKLGPHAGVEMITVL
ncbi:hypothetical protein LTR95_001912 [Oleoguttula sp. CCFEE 5521]